jgi:hypothetical protein
MGSALETLDEFDKITVLLVFLILVINEMFLIGLSAVLLRKVKTVVRSAARKYYFFVGFYIVSKLSLCVYLQIKIVLGIPDFPDLKKETIETVLDNTIVLSDCSIVEMFLIAF